MPIRLHGFRVAANIGLGQQRQCRQGFERIHGCGVELELGKQLPVIRNRCTN